MLLILQTALMKSYSDKSNCGSYMNFWFQLTKHLKEEDAEAEKPHKRVVYQSIGTPSRKNKTPKNGGKHRNLVLKRVFYRFNAHSGWP